MHTMSIQEARAAIADVVKSTEDTLLTRRGKPIAAVVSLAHFEILLKQLDRDLLRTNLIETVRGCLRSQQHVEAAYLFGSWATGEWRSKSDVDVWIITSDLDKDTRNTCYKTISRCLHKTLRKPFDILMSTKSQFTERASDSDMLEAKVVREGVVLL